MIEQADADEAYNAEEKIQKESKGADAEINHNEEIKGDVKEQGKT